MRIFLAFLSLLCAVQAHIGEVEEEHSLVDVFLDSSLAAQVWFSLMVLGVILVVVFSVLYWKQKKTEKK